MCKWLIDLICLPVRCCSVFGETIAYSCHPDSTDPDEKLSLDSSAEISLVDTIGRCNGDI